MIDFIFGGHRSEAGEAITRSYYCLVPLFLKSAALLTEQGGRHRGGPYSSQLLLLFAVFQILTSLKLSQYHNCTVPLLPLSTALNNSSIQFINPSELS